MQLPAAPSLPGYSGMARHESQPAQGNGVCIYGVQDGQAERPANSVDNRSISILFFPSSRVFFSVYFT